LPMHYCVTSTSTTSLSTLSLHDALPIYPGQVTTRDVDATSACADGQRQATVRVGCTRPAVGHTGARVFGVAPDVFDALIFDQGRSEEHTSELQSRFDLVCRLLLVKKNK